MAKDEDHNREDERWEVGGEKGREGGREGQREEGSPQASAPGPAHTSNSRDPLFL